MSKNLEKIKGFVNYYREHNIITNDFFVFFENVVPVNISISYFTIMPYFEMGNIGNYIWTDSNIHILRTCLKHTIISYISAFMKGILHGDFHPGNVLLKTTKSAFIEYSIDDIGVIGNIETHGIRTWIMDFELTRNIDKKNPT